MVMTGNDKKELRKGEKFIVTIQEVLHNTLLVCLEYRKAKFSGVLLNTTNRCGPYGISSNPVISYCQSYGIDPNSATSLKKDEVEKVNGNPPQQFPHTLDTRTTYDQKLQLPPPRQIYLRKRRSRRKVRMDMMDTDLALKIMSNDPNPKSGMHSSSCCCDRCAKQTSENHVEGKTEGKRKLLPESDKMVSKRKICTLYDGMKTITDDAKRFKLGLEDEDKDCVLKNVETRSQNKDKNDEVKEENSSVKRSPVIKISYKSPGGKGKVLKIPSRVHSSSQLSNNNDPKKKAMHERARKVVIRAKSEHFKYLKEHKPKTPAEKGKDIPTTGAHITKITKNGKLSKADRQSTQTDDENSSSSPPVQHTGNSSVDTKSKILPQNEENVVSGSKTASESKSKRLLRSITPQVLLQPLSGEGSESNASKSDKSDSGSTQNPSPSSSKRKDDSNLSHTISVTRCKTKEGVQWCQGDVVWGKIRGFPWWPGILRRILVKKASTSIEQIAIVDWFQSRTVSHIPCHKLESFSGSFDKRFSKKVKGNYKKAIQEAHEAEKKMSPEVRKLIMQFET